MEIPLCQSVAENVQIGATPQMYYVFLPDPVLSELFYK